MKRDLAWVFLLALLYAILLLVVSLTGQAGPLTYVLAGLVGFCTGVLLWHLVAR